MNTQSHRALTVALLNVWVALQGEYWLFWTLHWQSRGPNAYGDHLLYQRLYEARTSEIDRVAEIIGAISGTGYLRPEESLQATQRFVQGIMSDSRDNTNKALYAVKAVRYALRKGNDAAEGTPYALEINNALAGIADKQLEAEYLLKQRADWASPKSTSMAPLQIRPPVQKGTLSELTKAYGSFEAALGDAFNNPLNSYQRIKRTISDASSVVKGVAIGTAVLGLGVTVYRSVKKGKNGRVA